MKKILVTMTAMATALFFSCVDGESVFQPAETKSDEAPAHIIHGKVKPPFILEMTGTDSDEGSKQIEISVTPTQDVEEAVVDIVVPDGASIVSGANNYKLSPEKGRAGEKSVIRLEIDKRDAAPPAGVTVTVKVLWNDAWYGTAESISLFPEKTEEHAKSNGNNEPKYTDQPMAPQ